MLDISTDLNGGGIMRVVESVVIDSFLAVPIMNDAKRAHKIDILESA